MQMLRYETLLEAQRHRALCYRWARGESRVSCIVDGRGPAIEVCGFGDQSSKIELCHQPQRRQSVAIEVRLLKGLAISQDALARTGEFGEEGGRVVDVDRLVVHGQRETDSRRELQPQRPGKSVTLYPVGI